MHVKYWAPINSYPIGKVVQNFIHVYAKYWTPLHWFSFSFGQMLLNYFFTKYRTPLNFKSLLRWESRYYEKKDTNSEGVEEEYSSYMFWGKKEKIRSAINLPLFFHLL